MKLNWIPNTLSFANLFCGFLSIISSAVGSFNAANHEYFVYATLFILMASVFDVFDGRIARRINQPNPLGKDLDSFADLVTFGLAPGFMFFFMFFGIAPFYPSALKDHYIVGSLFSFLFPLFAALRLAKFNTSEERDFFLGIPSPIAGGSLVLILCFDKIGDVVIPIDFAMGLPWWGAFLIFLFYAFLMMSKFIFLKKPPSFMNFSRGNSFFSNSLSVLYLIGLVLFFKYFLLFYTLYYTLKPLLTFSYYKGNNN